MSVEEYEAIIRQQGEALAVTVIYSFFLTMAVVGVLLRWGVSVVCAKLRQRFAARTQMTVVAEEEPLRLADVLERATPKMRRQIEKGLLATAIESTCPRRSDL